MMITVCEIALSCVAKCPTEPRKFFFGFKIDMVEPFRGSLQFVGILEQERVPISELIRVGSRGEYHTQGG
jgi:hypothetical protein